MVITGEKEKSESERDMVKQNGERTYRSSGSHAEVRETDQSLRTLAGRPRSCIVFETMMTPSRRHSTLGLTSRMSSKSDSRSLEDNRPRDEA
ncbi:hypothetical protein Tdes44962_MAKER09793 [Teratosphaeria destructans]|uniref:Uncharacterized protein n=1 Tax=Teratosphaeria destructans TaxID=418781 RepID=A0A9W7SRH6_9PEZI|nr:hypothetical protein Tdes44962_MAKER09793 [Teratosphaeria destructans]